MTTQFSIAKNMFSAYLNQDFDLVFGSVDDAIRTFVEHSSPDEVFRLQDEIRIIQGMGLSETDLENLILQDLGCCYQYLREWPSGDTWLTHVITLLAR
jgi:hypothetical protein